MKVHFAIDLKIATISDSLSPDLMNAIEDIVRDSVGEFRKSVQKKLGGAVTATAVLGAMAILDGEAEGVPE